MTTTLKPSFQHQEELGGYVILEKIDQTYWFTAYVAFDPALNRHVAIKIIHGPYSETFTDIDSSKDFAKKLAGLNHPHLVAYYKMGHDRDFYYHAQSYNGAYNLRDWLFNYHAFDTGTAHRILMPLISALEYAAEREIYHLDLRPRSVVFSLEHTLYLTNLGLFQNYLLLTGKKSYDCLAHPHYASPEQILGNRMDHRTDIYSLGTMFFHLMTGYLPYDGEGSSTTGYFPSEEKIADKARKAHLLSAFPKTKAIQAEIPTPWIDLLEKMMAKDPADRFQTYGELEEAAQKLPVD
jgi:serine/threonine-protein kinase